MSSEKSSGSKCQIPAKKKGKVKTISTSQTNVLATVKLAKEGNVRAQNIVLSMLEFDVTEKYFLGQSQYMNPELFDDVAHERGITGLCGYPMCPNQFTDIYGNQSYIIRNNCVYDISRRRNFCSDICFEAYLMVRRQLSTLPPYLRDEPCAEIEKVFLPSLEMLCGVRGDVVDITGGLISAEELGVSHSQHFKKMQKVDEDFTSVNDVALDRLIECSENPPSDGAFELSLPGVSSDENNADGVASINMHTEVDKKFCTTKEDENASEMTVEETFSKMGEEKLNYLSTKTSDLKNEVLKSENVPLLSIVDHNMKDTKDKTLENCAKVIVKDTKLQGTDRESGTSLKTASIFARKQHTESVIVIPPIDYLATQKLCEFKSSSTAGTDKKSSQVTLEEKLMPIFQVERFLREWMTFQSLRVVLGDEYLRGMLEHFGHEWQDYDNGRGLDAQVQYVALCHKLDRQEKEEMMEEDRLELSSRIVNGPLKPMPDYQQLTKDAKRQQLKVTAFFHGNEYADEEGEIMQGILEEEAGVNESSKIQEAVGNDSELTARRTDGKRTHFDNEKNVNLESPLGNDGAEDTLLPMIDHFSQLAWRRKIVMTKIETQLLEMVQKFALSKHVILRLISDLVSTFELSAQNIVMRMAQWKLVTLILLKLLSIRYVVINEALTVEVNRFYVSKFLGSYSLDDGYLDRLLTFLTEIQPVLNKNYPVPEESSGDKHRTENSDVIKSKSADVQQNELNATPNINCDDVLGLESVDMATSDSDFLSQTLDGVKLSLSESRMEDLD